MGVPTSDAGYTAAMPGREDHEVHKDMWWHWGNIFRIKLYMFRTVPLSIIRSFSLYTQQWYMSYKYCCACSEKLLTMVICPKHVEFYSKNKFEKLVRLV